MMRAVRLAALAVLVGAAGCGGGGQRLSTSALPAAPALLHLSSPAFVNGARLAPQYTCDGAGEEPEVRVGTVPAGARELVAVVTDPDAPGGTFVHLTRYGIPPRATSVSTGGLEGRTSTGGDGWTPPCPPKGDKAHHYIWSVYVLREPTGLAAGASPPAVTGALAAHGVLARGTLTALYGR